MDKHLIIIDLDGTLMLNFAEYEVSAVEYLKKLNQQGHKILIATGRPFRSSHFVYKEIGLNTPIINYNGALVENPTDSNFPKTDLRIFTLKVTDRTDSMYAKIFVNNIIVCVPIFCSFG